MKSTILLATALLFSGAAFADKHEHTAAPTAADAKAGDIVVKVEGMTCSSCMSKVKKALAKMSEEKYKGKGYKFEVVLNQVSATLGTIKTGDLKPAELEQLKKDIAATIKKAGYTPLI